ncbi:phosphotransferase [Candidatus Dojkabacteria bacterium]|nr:phosphotransferase [Candidatus Dojkabacteria bacterium]
MIIEALQNEILAKNLPFNKFEWIDLKHGATNCIYARVHKQDGRMCFLKAGEKVGKEVDNLQFLQANNINFVPRLEEELSSKDGILVTEYLESPNYGLDMVDALYEGDIEVDQFLRFQQDTFNAISSFYGIELTSPSLFSSDMLSVRANERLQMITSDKNSLLFEGQYDLRNILDTPIIYNKNGDEISLPSMSGMLANIRNYEQRLHGLSPRVIHGDFHAPNVALGNDALIKFVDLSDIRYGEDPSWDLGKWLNYIKRFHPIVTERIAGESENSINVTIETNLTVVDPNSTKFDFAKIEKHAINHMSSLLGENPDILAKRTSIAEWVVNISTIRRHTKIFPYTTKQVLSCICSSYLDIFNN